MDIPHFVYLFICSSTFLAILNNDAMNIGVWMTVWFLNFNSFAHIPRNEMDGSSGNPMN